LAGLLLLLAGGAAAPRSSRRSIISPTMASGFCRHTGQRATDQELSVIEVVARALRRERDSRGARDEHDHPAFMNLRVS
jgi:hypothetical protein